METLLKEVRSCTHCAEHLPAGCRPIVSFSKQSSIVIIGQAPGSKVHASGIPWKDKSGDRLRDWLGVSESQFYDPSLFAIIPMGFCYPGKGKQGDLPPRPECAPLWHDRILEQLQEVRLTLIIGQYAQSYYLGERRERNLTATVRNFRKYLPEHLPLPHPSPRNNIWMRKNPWFEEEVLPELRKRTTAMIS